jgi:L-threonylcarbamoyladenylate synthase
MLLSAFGRPLAAPSANRFGRISPTDAAAVRTELGDAVPLVLDGGPCRIGLESTVLEVNANEIRLLRAGGISVEEIERVAGPIERANVAQGNRPLAPGQLAHHYAPRKPLRLLAGEEPPHSTGAGWLAFGPVGRDSVRIVENLSPLGDLREAAANFFRALRTLDDDPRVDTIYARRVPPQGLGLAINERLERAAVR